MKGWRAEFWGGFSWSAQCLARQSDLSAFVAVDDEVVVFSRKP